MWMCVKLFFFLPSSHPPPKRLLDLDLLIQKPIHPASFEDNDPKGSKRMQNLEPLWTLPFFFLFFFDKSLHLIKDSNMNTTKIVKKYYIPKRLWGMFQIGPQNINRVMCNIGGYSVRNWVSLPVHMTNSGRRASVEEKINVTKGRVARFGFCG